MGQGHTQIMLFLIALKIFVEIPWFLLGGRISYWDAKRKTHNSTNLEEESHILWGFFQVKLKEPY